MYFIGLNPGGNIDDEEARGSILDSLVYSRIGGNAFDQDWSSPGRKYMPGFAPMQARFKAIASFLGIAYGAIPASNLVFTRSVDVASHPEFAGDRAACAQVHRIFMDAIRPRKLWVMGSTDQAADLLTDQKIEWQDARHAKWSIGHGRAMFCGREVELCHTPHLSLWDPTGKEDLLRFAFGMS